MPAGQGERPGSTGREPRPAYNLPGIVGVRDSKDPAGPALVFGSTAWRAFVGMAKAYDPA
ncbi:DUF397 domain-containing protein [Micromonospora sp. B9E7]|uniref:DUF397 domain-containing protein n=1 Tax=Micromonospora sp. B9E7 TaxID=3153574 RepID=UPI00325DC5FB